MPRGGYNECVMALAQYTVIIEPEPVGGFSVHCPALPGCVAQGETREEAFAAIEAAIGQSLTAWAEDDLPPPADSVDYVGDELYEILAARADDDLPLTCETVEVQVDIGDRQQSAFEDERPPVLVAPGVPGVEMIKRGALKALIRHSGMTPEEFEIFARTEARILALGDGFPPLTVGDDGGTE